MITQMSFDWPGWPLTKNSHAEEFDFPARKRMVDGAQALVPLLEKYGPALGDIVLEIGPFFNPLITPQQYQDKTIFYWEGDEHACKWLGKSQELGRIYPIYCNLNQVQAQTFLQPTQRGFDKLGLNAVKFDSVVISQVFNYIDYKGLLTFLNRLVKKEGLLFVNNVADYGLPKHFSNKRPKSIEDTILHIELAGFEVKEYEVHRFTIPHSKKEYKRVVLVAQRRGQTRLYNGYQRDLVFPSLLS